MIWLGAGDLGPDEACYWQQGACVRERGPVAGLRALAERFLSEPVAMNFPSPMRWLWVYLMAVASPWRRNLLSFASALSIPAVVVWALGPLSVGPWGLMLAATSPLVWQLSKRCLQDLVVGVAAMAALGCGLHGHALGLAVAVFALLSLKEAALLYVPAIATAAILQGSAPTDMIVASTAGTAGAAFATRMLVGPLTWQLFARARQAPENLYTKWHQSGFIHRLLVDLFLVSPLACIVFAATNPPLPLIAFCALTLLAHAVAPVRNVRTVVAVDVAARAWVAHALGPVAIPLLCVDAFIFHKIRRIYDPVTSELTQALGMSPKHAVQAS